MLTVIQKSISAGIFAALLLSCTPVVNASAAPSTTTAKKCNHSYFTLGNAAYFTLFLLVARLWTREGDNSAVRYNLEELALLENVPANLYYLVDDGVIGHFGKKPYLTVDMDNSRVEVPLADKTDENGKIIKDAQGNKIKVSTAVWPKGLMGWAAFYIKPIIAAVGVTVFTKILFDAANEIKSGETFIEAFARQLKAQTTFSIGKFTDYGAASSLTAVNVVASGLGLSK